jgi:Protein of unknown function (DUF3096)
VPTLEGAAGALFATIATMPARACGNGIRPLRGGDDMVIGVAHLSPALSILFGILILVLPRFLNYLVGIYLILAGLLGLGWLR